MDKLEDENIDIESKLIINSWKFCQTNIDENYQYIKKDPIFNLCSNILYYGIAFPILSILFKIIYDLKIEGKENINKIKNGAISISNHVLYLDCAMIGIAFGKKKIYFTTLEDNFKIPVVRRLIKLLRAIPIPKTIENKKYFMKAIDQSLQEENVIHFYPEGVLVNYSEKIRNFKNGAFDFAVKNKVDIIPIIFKFRNPKGLRKIFKRKKDVTLKILEPIKYEELVANTEREKIEILKQKTKNEMIKEKNKSIYD